MCAGYPTHQQYADQISLPTAMDSTDYVMPWKRAVSEAVWARSVLQSTSIPSSTQARKLTVKQSWTLPRMQTIQSGPCILDLSRTVRYLSSVLSKCTRNGTAKPTIVSESGSVPGHQEGESQAYSLGINTLLTTVIVFQKHSTRRWQQSPRRRTYQSQCTVPK